MPWLDGARAAQHLFLSEHRFLALVKSGKFPKPSYHLGARSPRWNSEALDRSMDETTVARDIGEAVNDVVIEIQRRAKDRTKEAR